MIAVGVLAAVAFVIASAIDVTVSVAVAAGAAGAKKTGLDIAMHSTEVSANWN